MQNYNQNAKGDAPSQAQSENPQTSVPASWDAINELIAGLILQTYEHAGKFGARATQPDLPPEDTAVYAYIALKNSQTFAALVELFDRRRINTGLMPCRPGRQ